jgi:hypothetical protein
MVIHMLVGSRSGVSEVGIIGSARREGTCSKIDNSTSEQGIKSASNFSILDALHLTDQDHPIKCQVST